MLLYLIDFGFTNVTTNKKSYLLIPETTNEKSRVFAFDVY